MFPAVLESVTIVCVEEIPVGLLTTRLKETVVLAVAISTVSGVIVKETRVGCGEISACAAWGVKTAIQTDKTRASD